MAKLNTATDVSSIPHTNFDDMRRIANELIDVCLAKDGEYSASWCKRGGIGAWFTIVRKLDRLENQMKINGFNVLDVQEDENLMEGLEDTLRDTAAYLLLFLEKREKIRAVIRESSESSEFSEFDELP